MFQAQRSSIQQDDIGGQEKQAVQGEEQQQKITSFEEAFKAIKEATGVSDTMVCQFSKFITYALPSQGVNIF